MGPFYIKLSGTEYYSKFFTVIIKSISFVCMCVFFFRRDPFRDSPDMHANFKILKEVKCSLEARIFPTGFPNHRTKPS